MKRFLLLFALLSSLTLSAQSWNPVWQRPVWQRPVWQRTHGTTSAGNYAAFSAVFGDYYIVAASFEAPRESFLIVTYNDSVARLMYNFDSPKVPGLAVRYYYSGKHWSFAPVQPSNFCYVLKGRKADEIILSLVEEHSVMFYFSNITILLPPIL